MNIPNALTGIRFLLVGVFIYLFAVPTNYIGALIVYVVAALTDVLDGYIARKCDMITDIGKLIDPLADKLMLITALVFFYIHRWIPLAILLFVVIKESVMIAGGIFLYRRKVVVFSENIGKIASLVFNLGVVMTFFYESLKPWNVILLYLAVALSFGALLQYGIKRFWGYFKKARIEDATDADIDNCVD